MSGHESSADGSERYYNSISFFLWYARKLDSAGVLFAATLTFLARRPAASLCAMSNANEYRTAFCPESIADR